MSRQKMYRSTKEYKEYMKTIREKVKLPERSELFRKFRALLRGKNQDCLEIAFTKYMETFDSDFEMAEKHAMREIVARLLPAPGKEHAESTSGETLRIYELLTEIPRDKLKEIPCGEVQQWLFEAAIYR